MIGAARGLDYLHEGVPESLMNCSLHDEYILSL
jgi:hypothetical protein